MMLHCKSPILFAMNVSNLYADIPHSGALQACNFASDECF